jgi:hypothetical protein
MRDACSGLVLTFPDKIAGEGRGDRRQPGLGFRNTHRDGTGLFRRYSGIPAAVVAQAYRRSLVEDITGQVIPVKKS